MAFSRTRRAQSGVALAIVVWFIAGMSLLVAGIVSQGKMDTRMAQLHVARAKTVAAGDGAILLSLAAAVAGNSSSAGAGSGATYRIGGLDVEIEIIPAAGLIDLNSAAPPLLAALFNVGAGLEAAQAQILADNVVKWRAPPRGSQAPQQNSFAAPEDLLRVAGVNRAVLDKVRDYITAGASMRAGGNWAASPAGVLAIVEQVNPRAATSAREQRERNVQASRGASAASGRPLAGGIYRVDARVRYGGRMWLRRSWVSTESRSGSSLPWQAVRLEAPRVVGS